MTLRRVARTCIFSLRYRNEKTPVCCGYRGLKIIHDFQRMIFSADIFDNGRVQLLINKALDGSSVFDDAKYIDVFRSCLMQHKKSVPINSPEQ